MEKKITIKDVKIGMLICDPAYVSPDNEIQEIIDIEYNPKAGEPVKDMFGGVVWSEPFATIKTVGKTTGKRRGYTVQSADSELQDWITFIKNPEDRMNAIYADRRDMAIHFTKVAFEDEDLARYIKEVKKCPAQLKSDKAMSEVVELIDKLKKIITTL
jgi:hypothetical protein